PPATPPTSWRSPRRKRFSTAIAARSRSWWWKDARCTASPASWRGRGSPRCGSAWTARPGPSPGTWAGGPARSSASTRPCAACPGFRKYVSTTEIRPWEETEEEDLGHRRRRGGTVDDGRAGAGRARLRPPLFRGLQLLPRHLPEADPDGAAVQGGRL